MIDLCVPMKKIKRIALVAHDNRKLSLINWCKDNISELKKHELFGTGTTARLITEKTSVYVNPLKSGPMGGDLQLGAMIAEGKIDMMIFFWDPLEAQPHDPDIKALLRISVLYDIPIANNRASADFILSSPFMSTNYERKIYDFEKEVENRVVNVNELIE